MGAGWNDAIDYRALLRSLVAAVAEVTGIPADHIFADQPAAASTEQPDLPFFTIHVASTNPYGRDYGEEQDMLIGPRGIEVSFNCFAETHAEANGSMQLWAASLFAESIRLDLSELGFCVMSAGPVLDMTERYDTGYQPRAYMQAEFGTTSVIEAPTGQIDNFRINGQYGALPAASPAAPSGNQQAGGATMQAPAPARVSTAALVGMYAGSGLDVADATLSDGNFAPCIGVVIASDNGMATIQTTGVTPAGLFSGLLPASRYFLGDAGQIIRPPLGDVRFAQLLGTAVSDSQLLLQINPAAIVRRAG